MDNENVLSGYKVQIFSYGHRIFSLDIDGNGVIPLVKSNTEDGTTDVVLKTDDGEFIIASVATGKTQENAGLAFIISSNIDKIVQ